MEDANGNRIPITDLYSQYWAKKTVPELLDDIKKFHQDVYYSGQQFNTEWQGYKILKYPGDIWNVQEIIFERKPDVIIETGTAMGGSALFMAHMMDFNNKGKVITVDVDKEDGLPNHKRITYFIGSSTDKDIVKAIKKQIPSGASVMVILDSDHTQSHVEKELAIYAPLVTRGQFLIVEDSNICGNPIDLIHFKDGSQGPMGAIKKFMSNNKEFVFDRPREHKHMVTFHPNGWLKRVQ